MSIQNHNLKLTEQEYRDLPIPSYSLLSAIEKQGVDVIHGDKINLNLKFGSLVDCMLTEPGRVKDLFHQGVAVKPPTANVKKILDKILTIYCSVKTNSRSSSSGLKRKTVKKKTSSKLDDYDSEILSAAKILGVYKNYSDAKTIKTVKDAGGEYFKDKITSQGKTLIKPEMWALASQTVNTLKTHPFTAKYFISGVKDIEIIYQFKFDTEVDGMRCKGMLDILIILHDKKLIIPVDLKTGEEPVINFPVLYTVHGYYIQGALYREALKNIVDNDFNLSEYKVQPFEFIYISKVNPNKPLVFVVPDEMHQHAMDGFTDRHGYKNKGVHELLGMYYDNENSVLKDYTEEENNNKGKVAMTPQLICGNNETRI